MRTAKRSKSCISENRLTLLGLVFEKKDKASVSVEVLSSVFFFRLSRIQILTRRSDRPYTEFFHSFSHYLEENGGEVP
jgi:hypothetical protein